MNRKHKYGYDWYFGQTVAYIRKKKGINQIEFAKKLGVNQSVLSRIENGLQTVKLVDLASFAINLGLRTSLLYKMTSASFTKYKPKRDETSLLHDIAVTCDQYIE